MANLYQIVGGGFQGPDGSPLSFGTLTARLSAPATDLTGTIAICDGFEVAFPLDANGNVATSSEDGGACFIWPTDKMQPFPIVKGDYVGLYPTTFYYSFTVESAEGQLVWGPNFFSLSSPLSSDFVQTQSFIGDGSTTTFPLTDTPVADGVFLYVNGVAEGNFTVSGSTVTLGFTPDALSEIDVISYSNQIVSPVFVTATPTGGGTSFTLPSTPAANTLLLYRAGSGSGGLLQKPGVDYSISGNTITLTTTIGTDTLYARYATAVNFTTPVEESPSGTLNGSNTVFTLSKPCLLESLQYFWNGLKLTSGIDYTLGFDEVTITMTEAPASSDELFAAYDTGGVINLGDLVPFNPA